jgi:hypothetical protein
MLLPEMLPDKVGASRTDSLISRKRGPSTPDRRSGQTSFIGCLVSHNTPHLFCVKSAEMLEKKRVEFLMSAKKRKRVRKNMKGKGIGDGI